MASIRKLVSKKKRRYIDKKNGFDLDLSYITKNIIAMGFPSEGSEGIYRNPYSEVIRFLDHNHKDHFKLYNLCSERGYDAAKFYNRVEVFPFDDHNAPPFDLILKFCQNVEQWLSQSEQNIAVIHCKAGKGRTGLMICSWLLYSKEWTDPNDAMNFYAAMRTYNQKGVTIPSQIRYIKYFGESRLNGIPEMKTLYLSRMTMPKLPKLSTGGELRFIIYAYKTPIFRWKKNNSKEKENDESVTFDCGNLAVTGDIKVEFFEKTLTSSNVMFTFWFCTGFIGNNYLKLQQNELDKANKDRNNKIYPKGFYVELFLKPSENAPEPVKALEDGQQVSKEAKDDAKKSTDSPATPKTNYKFSAIMENSDPNEIAAGLLKDMISLLAKYSGDNFDVSQESLQGIASEDLQKINQAINDLKKLNLGGLKKANEKLAFWLNLYHLLLLHTTISTAPPKSLDDWIVNHRRMYEIAGYSLSLLDIEQCILRSHMSPPEGVSKDYAVAKWKKGDPRFNFAVQKEELRLPCVMSFGIAGTPVLFIYDHNNISTQLEDRTRAFLIKNVALNSDHSEITLPPMFSWYAKDYGKKKLVKWVSDYLEPETKKALQSAKNVNVKFAELDWTLNIPLVHLYNLYSEEIEKNDGEANGSPRPEGDNEKQKEKDEDDEEDEE